MSERAVLRVEVAYALPQRQWRVVLDLPEGATVAEALAHSGLATQLPDVNLDALPVGVFGKACTRDTRLRDGDRVELYRPLLCDPKDNRRQRAAQSARRPGR